MVLASLTPSIEKTETSSAGALQTEFTRQWGLSEFNATSDTLAKGITGEVVIEPNAFHFSLHYIHHAQTSNNADIDAFYKRILITTLLFTQTPDKGLDELLETLGEINEFYGQELDNDHMALPEPQRISIRLNSPITRPEFPIAVDEG